MLTRASALHTLIRQRHLTPSCGGRVPTAERTLDPARMFMESLTTGPELENSQGHQRRSALITVADKCLLYSESDEMLRCRKAPLCANAQKRTFSAIALYT